VRADAALANARERVLAGVSAEGARGRRARSRARAERRRARNPPTSRPAQTSRVSCSSGRGESAQRDCSGGDHKTWSRSGHASRLAQTRPSIPASPLHTRSAAKLFERLLHQLKNAPLAWAAHVNLSWRPPRKGTESAPLSIDTGQHQTQGTRWRKGICSRRSPEARRHGSGEGYPVLASR
jgi:hypothetical protein